MHSSITKPLYTSLFLLAACSVVASPPKAMSVSDGPLPIGQLPDTVTPVAYQIGLNIDPNNSSFAGSSQILVRLHAPTRHIWLHAQGLNVSVATVAALGGTQQAAQLHQVTDEGLARLDLAELAEPGTYTLSFAFDAPLDTHLDGLYKVVAKDTPYVFSHFEPTAARRAFVCFDEPRFKTPFEISLSIPVGQIAVSNMAAVGEQVASSAVQNKVVTFAATPPLPTYLIAFAVGPFDVVDGPHLRPTPLRPNAVAVRGIAAQGQGEHMALALKNASELVGVLEDYFGVAYPFAKLDLLAVPDFAAGAMENAGAITFRDWMLLLDPGKSSASQKLDASYVIAHELAHQWFGDLVTMPWWDDLWLNESFATWLGYRTVNSWEPKSHITNLALSLVHGAMRLDSLQAARRIRQPAHNEGDILNAFDGITYFKGSGVLAMFDSYLGAERMREGISAHLQKYRFGSANADMFLQSLSQGAGEDIAESFKTFLDQPGVPHLFARVTCDPQAGHYLVLKQSRYRPTGSSVAEGEVWQIPVCWRMGDSRGSVQRSCAMLRRGEASIPLASCPSWLMPNADGAGYYHWSMPPNQLKKLSLQNLTAREQLSLADNLAAAFAANLAAAGDVLPILAQLAGSSERSVAQAPMGILQHMRDTMLAAADVPQMERWVRAVYGPALKKLGYAPVAGEDSERALLRAGILGFLARVGQDTEVRQKMAAAGSAYLGLSGAPTNAADPVVATWHPEAVAPELAELAIICAAETVGPAYTQAALQLLQQTDDATLRRTLVSALASLSTAADMALVRQVSLDGKLRSNEVWTLLARSMGVPKLQADTWNWFVTHYEIYKKRVPTHTLSALPHLGDSFCHPEDAKRLSSFFDGKVGELHGADRALAQATEIIHLCVAEREAQQASVRTFFAQSM